jgi:predicted Fe-Mo cluster-binding NifX family protein
MRIAVPMDENSANAKVCVAFARAPYFLFHNTETGANQALVNPAANAEGGAGIQAAQFVSDQKADVLITVRCGENAAEVLLAANIRILRPLGATVSENLTAYTQGKLEPLTHFHAGFHGQA